MRASIRVQALASTVGGFGSAAARRRGAGRSADKAAASGAAPRQRPDHRSFSFSPAIEDLRIDPGIEPFDLADRDAGRVGDRGQGVAALDH